MDSTGEFIVLSVSPTGGTSWRWTATLRRAVARGYHAENPGGLFLPEIDRVSLLRLSSMQESPCPVDAEEMAENFLMGTLSEVDVRSFESHYRHCVHCAAVLDVTRDFLLAIRASAKTLRTESKE